MPGLLAFHAHPDDEVIATGGVLARYAQQGEQVVVVTATDGAEGEIHNYDDPESLKPRLAEMRAQEIAAALAILGVKHHEFLGYRDSGMMGTEANAHPEAFWKADFVEAVGRLVRLIRRYQPEVMVIYDPFGGYGHPDHINVHRVGLAAFFGCRDRGWFPLTDDESYWAPAKLYWTAWDQSRVQRLSKYWPDAGDDVEDEDYLRRRRRGYPDEEISARIDITPFLDAKLRAIAAHRSQIPPDWLFLRVPEAERPDVLGTETFVRAYSAVTTALPETDLFAGLR